MKKVTVKIVDPQGFHARPVGVLVNELKKYTCEATIFHNGRVVECDSVLGVLALGIPTGEDFVIAADGKQEAEALRNVVEKLQEIEFIA